MRLGGWVRRIPRQKATGYGLMILGSIILLVSVPFYVYAALLGGLMAYAGYVLRGR